MYCTVGQLRESISGLTADSTKVTEEYMTSVIRRRTAYINAMICQLYQAPVDAKESPTSFSILEEACINLCRPPLNAKLGMGVSFQDGAVQYPPGNELAKKAMAMLEEIKSGVFKLPDAVELGEDGAITAGYYDTDDVTGIPHEANKKYRGRGANCGSLGEV